MTGKTHRPRFVVCIDTGGYPASLELCKVYRQLADARGEKVGLIRVIDEMGEDYLYAREMFVPIQVPDDASRLLARIGKLQRRR